MLKTICLATAAVALIAATASANAYEFDPLIHTQQAVKYNDLDINRADGAATLYGRIKSAAHNVCGNTDSRDLHDWMAYHACVSDALGRAVAELNAPLVTALYYDNEPTITVASAGN